MNLANLYCATCGETTLHKMHRCLHCHTLAPLGEPIYRLNPDGTRLRKGTAAAKYQGERMAAGRAAKLA